MDDNEKNIRKKIWEILVNSPDITDIIKKQNKQELQKKVYDDIVDLKGYIEKEKEDKVLDTINQLTGSLGRLRDILQNKIVD